MKFQRAVEPPMQRCMILWPVLGQYSLRSSDPTAAAFRYLLSAYCYLPSCLSVNHVCLPLNHVCLPPIGWRTHHTHWHTPLPLQGRRFPPSLVAISWTRRRPRMKQQTFSVLLCSCGRMGPRCVTPPTLPPCPCPPAMPARERSSSRAYLKCQRTTARAKS